MNTENSAPQKSKLPLLAMLLGPFSITFDRIKYFFTIGAVFSTLLVCLFIAGGQDALCYNSQYSLDHYCSTHFIALMIVHLAALFIICILLRIWYQTALQNIPFTIKELRPQWGELKIAGGFIFFVATLLLAVTSFYLLLTRVPNPDWQIELTYFTVVSLGFLAPLLTLRFTVYFAFFASGEKAPSPIVVWKKTSDNGLALFSSVILLIFITMFFMQSLMNSFSQFEGNISVFTIIGSEYLFDIALVFLSVCFMNYCYLQKIFLFERNNNEKPNHA